MALQKSITLPNGISGNYIRVGDSYEMNRREESVTAHVTLFLDAAHAQARPDLPLAVIALVQLLDAEFDSYLGRDALATAAGNVVAQLYAAAKSVKVRSLVEQEIDLTDAADV
jgi:ketopantoate hydroxymethyltransferase